MSIPIFTPRSTELYLFPRSTRFSKVLVDQGRAGIDTKIGGARQTTVVVCGFAVLGEGRTSLHGSGGTFLGSFTFRFVSWKLWKFHGGRATTFPDVLSQLTIKPWRLLSTAIFFQELAKRLNVSSAIKVQPICFFFPCRPELSPSSSMKMYKIYCRSWCLFFFHGVRIEAFRGKRKTFMEKSFL